MALCVGALWWSKIRKLLTHKSGISVQLIDYNVLTEPNNMLISCANLQFSDNISLILSVFEVDRLRYSQRTHDPFGNICGIHNKRLFSIK